MEQNKQPLQIRIDGELTNEFTPAQPSVSEMALSGIRSAYNEARLQTRAFVFDSLHNTSYCAIRRQLLREQREQRFIASIGLVKIIDKK